MSETGLGGDRSFITVVSGIPRSGTSLMMQMLAAGGLPALTDDTRPADPSNPQGYFEFEPVKRLRLDAGWLDQARGRAVKIIHVLLRELPTDGQFNYRIIMMKRPLDAVIASQGAMLERQGRKGAPANALKPTYDAQLRDVQNWLDKYDCFGRIDVNYNDVLSRQLETAQKINAFVEGGLDVKAMADAVNPSLCHHSLGDPLTE